MGQIGLALHVSHLYDEKTLTLKLWIWGVLSHSTNAENPMCGVCKSELTKKLEMDFFRAGFPAWRVQFWTKKQNKAVYTTA